MSRNQKICICIVALALAAGLIWQGISLIQQGQIHAEKMDYWQNTVPQLAEQFAEVENFTPMNSAAGIAEENVRYASQQQRLWLIAGLEVVAALLLGLLIYFIPGWVEASYAKRGKESPAARKARLKREKHGH